MDSGNRFIHLDRDEYQAGYASLKQMESVLFLLELARHDVDALDELKVHIPIINELIQDLNRAAISCLEALERHND